MGRFGVGEEPGIISKSPKLKNRVFCKSVTKPSSFKLDVEIFIQWLYQSMEFCIPGAEEERTTIKDKLDTIHLMILTHQNQ